MNDNIKIAKQLMKIAKYLKAEQNVADNPGKYENFTGKINYEGNEGQVQDATFELKKGMIIWQDGTWVKGEIKRIYWYKGTWQNGVWNDGAWEKGDWMNGTWKDGVWYKGTWNKGTWENGIWKQGNESIWKQGKWIKGLDDNNQKHGQDDSPDQW